MARRNNADPEDLALPPERPVTLEGFAGHARQVAVLQRSLEKGMLAQSLLFAGQEGLGKATLAWKLAAALQCASPTPWACGECPSCRKMVKGLHPDVRIITLEKRPNSDKMRTEIVIEQIREDILKPIVYPPYEGNRLVFIIDPADLMNTSAQNCLLKSLEEPPRCVQFILVARNSGRLKSTIRSRCQVFNFYPLPAQDMESVASRSGIKAKDRSKALALAAGAPGKLFDNNLKAQQKRRDRLITLLEAGLDLSRWDDAAKAAEALAKEDPQDVLLTALRLTADCMRCLASGADSARPESGELAEAARRRGADGLARLSDRLAEAPEHLAHNVNTRLLWEHTFLVP